MLPLPQWESSLIFKVELGAAFVRCEVCLVEALVCAKQSWGLQASQCSGAHLAGGMCGSPCVLGAVPGA